MNKQTIILILAILLALIPTGVIAKNYVLERYSRLANEGLVAYSLSSSYEEPREEVNVEPTPKPNKQTTCDKCNGTKKVKTGDGILTVDCPCGAGCKCVGMTPQAPKSLKRVLLVTAPRWCRPCREIDSGTLDALADKGWNIGPNQTIEVIDYDTNQDIVQKYKIELVPTWVVIDGDKEVNRYSGYLNGYGVGNLFNNKQIVQSDTTFIQYKSKKNKNR